MLALPRSLTRIAGAAGTRPKSNEEFERRRQNLHTHHPSLRSSSFLPPSRHSGFAIKGIREIQTSDPTRCIKKTSEVNFQRPKVHFGCKGKRRWLNQLAIVYCLKVMDINLSKSRTVEAQALDTLAVCRPTFQMTTVRDFFFLGYLRVSKAARVHRTFRNNSSG